MTLTKADFLKMITIREVTYTVIQVIKRPIYHYSYYIGQIVYFSPTSNRHPNTYMTYLSPATAALIMYLDHGKL